ncbi:MAG: hypothetical protein AB8B93_04350 [Pseudomonadales bacterium]
MNESLDELIALLVAELDRLKVDLDTFRLTDNPAKKQITAELVRAIDERQDRLEELTALRAEAQANVLPSEPKIH